MVSKRKIKTPIKPRAPSRDNGPDNVRQSVATAALSLFEAAKIPVQHGADAASPWVVDGRYQFWPATRFWRSIEGERQGYTASTLIAAIRVDRAGVAQGLEASLEAGRG